MKIHAPKGTRDIMPDDSYKWQYIEDAFSRLASSYGFDEIRTPMFENTQLFNRGVGETTDIVQKEMYTFEDHAHRSMTLKPEGTSPAVRAFIESGAVRGVQPTKYYYSTSCFRYEKPQAGRMREFHQFGVEIFGSESMLADAEAIALADDFLTKMGVDDLKLHINSVGCRKCRPVYREALQNFLMPRFKDLSDESKERFNKNPMRILDSKDEGDKKIAHGAPHMIDYLCDDCRCAFMNLQEYLNKLDIKYSIDPKIVRGLDYYTKTAFEFMSDQIGAQGTVCGGGRYDHLINEIGGSEMPGVGFGLGKERLLILMEQNGHEFGGKPHPKYFVACADEGARGYALSLVKDMRSAGMNVISDVSGRKLKAQLRYADKADAEFVVIIGDEEAKTDELTIRNMVSGEQNKIIRKEFLN